MGRKAKYGSQGKAGGKGREREGGKEGKRKRQKERRAPHSSKWQSIVESQQGVPWLFHLLSPWTMSQSRLPPGSPGRKLGVSCYPAPPGWPGRQGGILAGAGSA